MRARLAVGIALVGVALAGCDMLWGPSSGLGALVEPGTPVMAHVHASLARVGSGPEGITETRLLSRVPEHRVITTMQSDIQITVTAQGVSPITRQFPPSATDAQVQVPAGPQRQFFVDYLGTQNEILGEGQNTFDIVGGNTVVPVDIFPGIPGLAVQGVAGLPQVMPTDVTEFASFTVINQRTDTLANLQGSLRFLDLAGSDQTADFLVTDSPLLGKLGPGASTIMNVGALLQPGTQLRVLHVQPVVRGSLASGQVFIKRSGDTAPAAVVAGRLQFNRQIVSLAVDFLKGIGVGDFNRDGVPDVAVSDFTAGQVTLLPGTGGGVFGQPISFPVGSGPAGLAVADLNRDGFSDVVVANNLSDSVSVLLGGASPMLGQATSYDVGAQPAAVAIGDFNGDGAPDVAVANFNNGGPSQVSVLLNTGNGGLSKATDFDVGSGACSIAAGDINGDGNVDLVVANQNSGTVTVLLGTGNGSFQRFLDIPVGASPISIALGDLNADRIPDLVVISNGSPSAQVFLGTGHGGFGPARSFLAGSAPGQVVIADMDNDGVPDLAVADFSGNGVEILLGLGDGTFLQPQFVGTGPGPLFVAAADLNGDGRQDLVTSEGPAGQVTILRQTTLLPTALR